MISNRDNFCLTQKISDLQSVPHITASGPVLSAQDRTFERYQDAERKDKRFEAEKMEVSFFR